MSIKSEWAQLQHISRSDTCIIVGLLLGMMFLSVFAKSGAIASFAMIPAVGVLLYADRRGIRVATTPNLFGLVWLLIGALHLGVAGVLLVA